MVVEYPVQLLFNIFNILTIHATLVNIFTSKHFIWFLQTVQKKKNGKSLISAVKEADLRLTGRISWWRRHFNLQFGIFYSQRTAVSICFQPIRWDINRIFGANSDNPGTQNYNFCISIASRTVSKNTLHHQRPPRDSSGTNSPIASFVWAHCVLDQKIRHGKERLLV